MERKERIEHMPRARALGFIPLLAVLVSAGCGKVDIDMAEELGTVEKEVQEETEVPEELIRESTLSSRDEVVKETSIDLVLPNGASPLEWRLQRVISPEHPEPVTGASVTFNYGSCTYEYIACPGTMYEDISAMGYNWNWIIEGDVADVPYNYRMTRFGQGVIDWYEDGMDQCVIMQKSARTDRLVQMYYLIHHPEEGVVDEEAVLLGAASGGAVTVESEGAAMVETDGAVTGQGIEEEPGTG